MRTHRIDPILRRIDRRDADPWGRVPGLVCAFVFWWVAARLASMLPRPAPVAARRAT